MIAVLSKLHEEMQQIREKVENDRIKEDLERARLAELEQTNLPLIRRWVIEVCEDFADGDERFSVKSGDTTVTVLFPSSRLHIMMDCKGEVARVYFPKSNAIEVEVYQGIPSEDPLKQNLTAELRRWYDAVLRIQPKVTFVDGQLHLN